MRPRCPNSDSGPTPLSPHASLTATPCLPLPSPRLSTRAPMAVGSSNGRDMEPGGRPQERRGPVVGWLRAGRRPKIAPGVRPLRLRAGRRPKIASPPLKRRGDRVQKLVFRPRHPRQSGVTGSSRKSCQAVSPETFAEMWGDRILPRCEANFEPSTAPETSAKFGGDRIRPEIAPESVRAFSAILFAFMHCLDKNRQQAWRP